MSVQAFLSACSVFTGKWSCVEHHLFSLKRPSLSKRNNTVVYTVLWFCLKAVMAGDGYAGQLKAMLIFLSPAKTNHNGDHFKVMGFFSV